MVRSAAAAQRRCCVRQIQWQGHRSPAAKNGRAYFTWVAVVLHRQPFFWPMGSIFNVWPARSLAQLTRVTAVLVTATRRRLLLPAHVGWHGYCRAHIHRHHRLRRSDISHASAGGVDSLRAAPVQPAQASAVMLGRGGVRARMEHG